jgi:hypothetical protein
MVRRTGHSAGFTIAFAGISGLAVFAALAAAPARADDYAACAKFDNPLAYNQCLAAQGPVAHGTRATAPPPEGEDRPRGAWAAHGRGGQSIQASRGRNGRMVLEFSIGAASAGAHRPRKTQ